MTLTTENVKVADFVITEYYPHPAIMPVTDTRCTSWIRRKEDQENEKGNP